MLPLAVRLLIVFFAGACLGSLVNWAIYTLAWNPRPISPWGRRPAGPASTRTGRIACRFWVGCAKPASGRSRAVVLGAADASRSLGRCCAGSIVLVGGRAAGADSRAIARHPRSRRRRLPCIGSFLATRFCSAWMLAASFIDIDEKIIPDEITVTGTLLGLLLATLVPMSLLPHVVELAGPPAIARGARCASRVTKWRSRCRD